MYANLNVKNKDTQKIDYACQNTHNINAKQNFFSMAFYPHPRHKLRDLHVLANFLRFIVSFRLICCLPVMPSSN